MLMRDTPSAAPPLCAGWEWRWSASSSYMESLTPWTSAAPGPASLCTEPTNNVYLKISWCKMRMSIVLFPLLFYPQCFHSPLTVLPLFIILDFKRLLLGKHTHHSYCLKLIGNTFSESVNKNPTLLCNNLTEQWSKLNCSLTVSCVSSLYRNRVAPRSSA